MRGVSSFLKEPVNQFSLNTKEPKGWLHLVYIESVSSYYGIWIPLNFPSLATIVRSIFAIWHDHQAASFHDWVQRFFGLRITEHYLSAYQTDKQYFVSLPPLFVINQQQIKTKLLPILQQLPDEEITSTTIQQLLEDQLPPPYLKLITTIRGELLLLKLHLLYSSLMLRETITMEIFSRYLNIGLQLSPELSDYLFLSVLHQLSSKQFKFDDQIIEYYRSRAEQFTGMLQVMVYRLLAEIWHNRGDLIKQEDYYNHLLRAAPRQSWHKSQDLFNSQLGLARCSMARGDYFRSLTFYSFAKQSFSQLDTTHAEETMDLEFQKISALSANQQLQTGLYQINHGKKDPSAFLILIDGIQSCLTHYLRYRESYLREESPLASLLQSAVSLMQIYEDRVNQLYDTPLELHKFLDIAKLLTNDANRQSLGSQIQYMIEQLSFKDQKTIERVSVFYDDGRHIGDYELQKDQFKPVEQEQMQSLFSSAMSAVRMLISEATEPNSQVEEIKVGSKSLIYEQGGHITFCVMAKSSSPSLKQLLSNVVHSIEKQYQPFLANWSGDMSVFSDLPQYLNPLSFFAIDKA